MISVGTDMRNGETATHCRKSGMNAKRHHTLRIMLTLTPFCEGIADGLERDFSLSSSNN
jgi:hypothetical protein